MVLDHGTASCLVSLRFGAHDMTDFTVRRLEGTTWPDFADLAERHNGVWSGCWCLNFHEEGAPVICQPEDRRRLKEARVRQGRAHAALVYEDAMCVGWC